MSDPIEHGDKIEVHLVQGERHFDASPFKYNAHFNNVSRGLYTTLPVRGLQMPAVSPSANHNS